MKFKKYKLSVTLVEAVVVVAIFAVIAAATGSILFTASRSGSRLADKAKVFQDATWAMDYMVNEARWGADFYLAPVPFENYDLITFQSDTNHNGTDPNDPCVWYWRGFNTTTVPVTSYGDINTLYRGLDTACNVDNTTSLQAANASRQELVGFVVDNPVNTTGSPVGVFGWNNTTNEFSVVLTTQNPSIHDNQTLKAMAVALNNVDGGVAVCECSDGIDNDGDGLIDYFTEASSTGVLYFQYNRDMGGTTGFDRTLDQILPGNKFQDFNFRNQGFRLWVDERLLSTWSPWTGYPAPTFSGDSDGYMHMNAISAWANDVGPVNSFYANTINTATMLGSGNWLNLSTQPAGDVYIFKDERRERYAVPSVHSSRVERAAAVTIAPTFTGYPWASDGYYNTYGNGAYVYVDNAGELHFRGVLGRTMYGYYCHARPVFMFGIMDQAGVNPECADGIDNDGDTLVDYPDDDGCVSPRDVSEIGHDPGCVDFSDMTE